MSAQRVPAWTMARVEDRRGSRVWVSLDHGWSVVGVTRGLNTLKRAGKIEYGPRDTVRLT